MEKHCRLLTCSLWERWSWIIKNIKKIIKIGKRSWNSCFMSIKKVVRVKVQGYFLTVQDQTKEKTVKTLCKWIKLCQSLVTEFFHLKVEANKIAGLFLVKVSGIIPWLRSSFFTWSLYFLHFIFNAFILVIYLHLIYWKYQ